MPPENHGQSQAMSARTISAAMSKFPRKHWGNDSIAIFWAWATIAGRAIANLKATHRLPGNQFAQHLLRGVKVRLAPLWAIYAVQTNAHILWTSFNIECIAIYDVNHATGIFSSIDGMSAEQ
jgi:hypothetical protein